MIGPQRCLLRLPEVAIWKFFLVLGELVINNFHHINTNPEKKTYRYLYTYPSKDSSASTEVWAIPWPSTMPITALWERDLGDSCVSMRADYI